MYNPSVVGKRLLLDVWNIDSNNWNWLKICNHLWKKWLKTISGWKSEHQFDKDNIPHGCTKICLLSESLLSIHTFVDEGKTTLNFFPCGLGSEFEQLNFIIRDYFEKECIVYWFLLFHQRKLKDIIIFRYILNVIICLSFCWIWP